MRKAGKIPGFTLPEIIVVMAIVALVILTGYSVYYIMNIQFENYRRASDDYLRVHEFSSTLSNDVFQCDVVSKEDDKLTLLYPDQQIEYFLYPNFAIRKTTIQVDTFYLQTGGLTASFKGQVIESGLIDIVSLELHYADKAIPCVIYKQYNADVLYSLK